MTFGTFYLLFLAVCTVFFSVKSEAIKDRFLINFADREDKKYKPHFPKNG